MLPKLASGSETPVKGSLPLECMYVKEAVLTHEALGFVSCLISKT